MLRKGEQPIPGYRLERQRGKGQFGVVWEATGPGGTKAALKFVDLEGRAGSKEFQAIQRVKTLRHVNLMPIQAIWLLDEEFHPLDDNVFEKMAAAAQDALRGTMSVAVNKPAWLVIAMPLADMSVADRLKQCRQQGLPGIPPDELIQYMEDTARALDFLNSTQHDMGEGPVSIQHADIKPDNLMLVSGAVQVCDMSLARTLKLGDSIAKTQSGMQGSIAYISPEAIRGTWNSRSDQYSLAISYFEMRTGELPFDSEMPLEVIGAHVEGRLNLSLLPEAEQAVVAQAASRDAEDRFATCGEFVRQLRRALADEPDSSIRVSSTGLKNPSAKTDVGPKQTEKAPKNVKRSTVPGGKSTGGKSSSGKAAGSAGEAVGHDDEFDGGEQTAPRSATKLLVVVVLLAVVGGAIAWATVPAFRQKVAQLIGGDSGSGDQGGGTAGGGGGSSGGRDGSGDKNADGGSSGKSSGGSSGGTKPGETPADGMTDKSSNGKGSNDKGANTKGVGDAQPPKSKKFDAELVVVPAKAKVKIVAMNGRDVENGLEHVSGEGGRVTFGFDAPDDATKIELEVVADDDTYETQTVPTSAAQLATGKLRVELGRTVAYWLQQGRRGITDGQWETALGAIRQLLLKSNAESAIGQLADALTLELVRGRDAVADDAHPADSLRDTAAKLATLLEGGAQVASGADARLLAATIAVRQKNWQAVEDDLALVTAPPDKLSPGAPALNSLLGALLRLERNPGEILSPELLKELLAVGDGAKLRDGWERQSVTKLRGDTIQAAVKQRERLSAEQRQLVDKLWPGGLEIEEKLVVVRAAWEKNDLASARDALTRATELVGADSPNKPRLDLWTLAIDLRDKQRPTEQMVERVRELDPAELLRAGVSIDEVRLVAQEILVRFESSLPDWSDKPEVFGRAATAGRKWIESSADQAKAGLTSRWLVTRVWQSLGDDPAQDAAMLKELRELSAEAKSLPLVAACWLEAELVAALRDNPAAPSLDAARKVTVSTKATVEAPGAIFAGGNAYVAFVQAWRASLPATGGAPSSVPAATYEALGNQFTPYRAAGAPLPPWLRHKRRAAVVSATLQAAVDQTFPADKLDQLVQPPLNSTAALRTLELLDPLERIAAPQLKNRWRRLLAIRYSALTAPSEGSAAAAELARLAAELAPIEASQVPAHAHLVRAESLAGTLRRNDAEGAADEPQRATVVRAYAAALTGWRATAKQPTDVPWRELYQRVFSPAADAAKPFADEALASVDSELFEDDGAENRAADKDAGAPDAAERNAAEKSAAEGNAFFRRPVELRRALATIHILLSQALRFESAIVDDVGERAILARRAARVANASDPKPVPAWLVEEGLALIRIEPPKSLGQGDANKQWKQLKRLATRCLGGKPQEGAAQADGAGESAAATFENEEASWRPQAFYLRGHASIYLSLAESNQAARLRLLDEALADFRAAGDEKYQGHPDYAKFLVGWSSAHLSSAFHGDDALQFVNIKQAVRIAKRATELPTNGGADVFNALGNAVEDEALYLGETSKFAEAAAAFTNAINQATLAVENRNKAKMGLARTLFRQVSSELNSAKVEQHEERLEEAIQLLDSAMRDFKAVALAAESRQWTARIRNLQVNLRKGTPKFDEAVKTASDAFKASDEFAEKNQVAQRHAYHWERQLVLADIELANRGAERERIDALLGPLLANSRLAGGERTVADADVVDVANLYFLLDLAKEVPANKAIATYLKSLNEGTSKTELGTLTRIRASVEFDNMRPETWVVTKSLGLRETFMVAAQPLFSAHEADLKALPDSLERRRVATKVAWLTLATMMYLKPLDKTSDWGKIRDARDLLARRVRDLDEAYARQRAQLRGAVEAVTDRPAEWNDALAIYEPRIAEKALFESIAARLLAAAATRAYGERSGSTVDAREINARLEVRALLAPIERRHLVRFKKQEGDLATWLDETRALLR